MRNCQPRGGQVTISRATLLKTANSDEYFFSTRINFVRCRVFAYRHREVFGLVGVGARLMTMHRKSLTKRLVAGIGFEPMTFGL